MNPPMDTQSPSRPTRELGTLLGCRSPEDLARALALDLAERWPARLGLLAVCPAETRDWTAWSLPSLEALRQTKAWMWEGDPLVQASYEELGISPHPLSVTDVLMALQTGMVETVYASPIGTLALQWFTKVNYMSRIRMGHATGGVLITKRQFNKIPDEHKETLKAISKKYLAQLVEQINQDNEKAIEVMQKNGLKLTDPPGQEELDRLHAIGEKIQTRLTGKLFDQKLIDGVRAHLKEIR